MNEEKIKTEETQPENDSLQEEPKTKSKRGPKKHFSQETGQVSTDEQKEEMPEPNKPDRLIICMTGGQKLIVSPEFEKSAMNRMGNYQTIDIGGGDKINTKEVCAVVRESKLLK